MATQPYTSVHAGGEPPCPFTQSGFLRIARSLSEAVLSEDHLDAIALDDDADIEAAQDATVNAWREAEAATAAFLRAHGSTAPTPLVDTALRVETLLCLTGLDGKSDLFDLVANTMLLRSRTTTGSAANDLLAAIIPWMYRASIIQSIFLEDDPDLMLAPAA